MGGKNGGPALGRNADSGRAIVVIGSINMDLVCRTRVIPRPGETILGSDLVTVPGGKGANQAVAAAKLGGNVFMVGRVGDDDFGDRLRNGLVQHGVNIEHVTISEGSSSGCAMILVDRKGENSIVVAPGANHKISVADIERVEGLLAKAAVVVMQLEIPFEAVTHAINICRRHGVYTILDPAPAPMKGGLPRAMYAVDVFTPNESEAEMLLGMRRSAGPPARGGAGRVKRRKVSDAKQIGSGLVARGAKRVVLKLGAKGAMIVETGGAIEAVKGFKVRVVDTTAAGDAFTGALAVARAEGMELSRAVRFANAAGAICCQSFGAQPALPDRKAVERMMGEQG